MTDEELFKQYQGGSDAALAELHRRLYRPLLRYVTYYTRGDKSSADDIVQQAFINVVTYKDRFTESHAVKPWLFTIACQLAMSWRKVIKRRSKLIEPMPNI